MPFEVNYNWASGTANYHTDHVMSLKTEVTIPRRFVTCIMGFDKYEVDRECLRLGFTQANRNENYMFSCKLEGDVMLIRVICVDRRQQACQNLFYSVHKYVQSLNQQIGNLVFMGTPLEVRELKTKLYDFRNVLPSNIVTVLFSEIEEELSLSTRNGIRLGLSLQWKSNNVPPVLVDGNDKEVSAATVEALMIQQEMTVMISVAPSNNNQKVNLINKSK